MHPLQYLPLITCNKNLIFPYVFVSLPAAAAVPSVLTAPPNSMFALLSSSSRPPAVDRLSSSLEASPSSSCSSSSEPGSAMRVVC
jgi:hypothetical protein